MLVEHAFVTILEQPQALNVARAFLEDLGFSPMKHDAEAAFRYRRGYEHVGHARMISEQPQTVHLTFDRGRIAVAAMITPQKKANALHQELLMAVVKGLEARLAERKTTAEARAVWDDVVARIEERAYERQQKQRRNLLTCLMVFGILLLGVVTLVVVLVLGNAK